MAGWFDDPQLREQAARDPRAPRDTLRWLAASFPEQRAAIAGNPACDPELREWLGSLRDPAVDAALALSRRHRRRRGLAIWGSSAGGGVVLIAMAVVVGLVFGQRLSAWAGGYTADKNPTLTTPQAESALLTPANVRATTGSADGIFDGTLREYSVAEYLEAFGAGSGDGTSSGDSSSSSAPPPDPIGCVSDVTGWMSLTGYDSDNAVGRAGDRILTLDDQSDGDDEQSRVFVSTSAALDFFNAESGWYDRCGQITGWKDSTTYAYQVTYLQDATPKVPVTARIYTEKYDDSSDDSPGTSYSINAWLRRGNVVEVLAFSIPPPDTMSELSPQSLAIIRAAALKLARAG